MSDDKAKEDVLTVPTEALRALYRLNIPTDVPEKVKVVMILKSAGLDNVAIGKQLGMTEGTVRYHLKKYDPDDAIGQAGDARKVFIASMFEKVAMEVLATISREDFAKLSLSQKIKLARDCAAGAAHIRVKIPETPDRDRDQRLLDGLAGEEDEEGSG